jgi:glycosyltransferase involved in cell wall biosynthesis
MLDLVSTHMRIGIIAPPWTPVPPPGYGGTEAFVDRLARGINDLGHEVLLFATGDSTCAVPRQWVLDQALPDQMGQMLPEVRHVIHAYEAMHEMDVVHDNTLLGALYAWRHPSLPVVTTNHGPFDEALGDLYRAVDERASIVAISHDQASRAYGIEIDAVIHHGVEADAFPVGTGDEGYFLFLGRMNAAKGAREAALVAREVGVRLVIAAKMREQDEREYFQNEVEPLLSDRIEYVGEADQSRKLELLAGAAALINPIQWPEPFGLVMVEAMACGTPVLAFPSGAAPEIIDDGETGFLCADLDEMCTRVEKVRDLDRHACRAAVERRFSLRGMAEKYVALFAKVVDRQGA